jgi:WD40 repeat protein
MAHDPALGLLLGARALDQGGGEPARSACYGALAQMRQVATFDTNDPATAVAASDDGAVLVAGDWNGRALLVRDGVPKSLKVRGRARCVAVDAGRDRVLVVGHLVRAMLLDLDGELVAELVAQPRGVLASVPQGDARLGYGCLEGGIQGDRIHLLTRDGRVRLFDLDGGLLADQQVEAPLPPGGWVGAAREPASGAVAFGGADGTVAVFADDGTVRVTPRRVHAGPVRFVQFAPDGRALLVAPGHVRTWRGIDPPQTAADGTATILDLDGNELQRLEGHRAPLTSASWSPDGTRVLTTSEEGIGLVWHVGRPGALPTILPHDKPVDGGMFFANGRRVLTRMDNADPVLWTVDGQRVGELRGHLGGCYAVAAVGNGDRLLTGSLDSRLLLWDARSAWCDEWRLDAGVHTAFFAAAGAVWVQTAEGLRLLRREAAWPAAVSAPDRRVVRRADPTMKLTVTSGARLIEVPGDGGGAVFSWGEDGRRELLPSHGANGGPGQRIVLASVAADVRTGRVALGGCNGEVLVVGADAADHVRHDLGMPGMALMGLGWLPEGVLLAATRDGLLLRIETDGSTRPLRDLHTYVFRLAMAPDGRVAAIADGNRRVHVIDAWSAAPLLTLPPMGGAICALEFAPDGRSLLVATSNGDVRVWPIALTASGSELVDGSPYQEAIAAARTRQAEAR